jgi:zinc protease
MRHRVAALLLTLVPTARADAPRAPKLAIETYRLPNGLTVILHRDPAVPQVTVGIAYHVGSKDERAGRTGFAHFFEHMMFRGTRHVPNYDVPLREAGAESNAFTNEDMTFYYETVPSTFLERALYLEAERLAFLPSALDDAKFGTEREVVKNERRQHYENVPYGLAEETILASVFPKGHPYSWSVIGSMKDLDAATLDDLRAFFAEFYHPGNTTLCLVGDFDPAEAKTWIARYFGPLRAGPERAKPAPVAAPRVARRIEQTDDVTLPRVDWAWPTVADDDDDAPALDLLAHILTDGEASRLYRALVRDAKVASDISADSATHEIGGLFTITALAATGKSATEVEAALEAEIRRLAEAPPTEDELRRALAKVETRTYRMLTSPLMRAVALARGSALEDDPEHYRKDIERYFQVTPGDLARVARTYLTPEKVVLVTVPGVDESKAVEAGPLPGASPDNGPPAPREPEPSDVDWAKLPGPSAPHAYQPPSVTRRRLSNGLDVWFVPWRTLPLVEARLLVPAGTANDTPETSGLATLTATLATQGTRSKTATALAEQLEALGVSLHGDAGPDFTAFGFGTLARNSEDVLKLLTEVLTEPRFDADDFARERGLLLTALRSGPDDPAWTARRVFRTLLYGSDHPYGLPPDGRLETVGRLTLDDVRAFHQAHYRPEGAVLIVAGDVEPDRLFATLERTIGRWRAESPARDEAPSNDAGTTKDGAPPIFLVDKPGAAQSVITVGRLWVGRDDPRYFATLLGNRVLGGDFLSRLNHNLREQHGYTYGAGSVFDYRRHGGIWLVRTSVRTDATAEAMREIVHELDAPRDGGKRPLSPEEIATARDAEERGWPESFASPASIAGLLAELARAGRGPEEIATFLDRLRGASAEAVCRAMNDLLDPGPRVVLVVGDREKLAPRLKAAGFENVRVIGPEGERR